MEKTGLAGVERHRHDNVEPLRVTTLHVDRLNIDGESFTATYRGVRKYFVHEGVLYIESSDGEYVINSDRWFDLTAYTHNKR